MSVFSRAYSRAMMIPTVLRTIRPIRRRQALAQLRHMVFGLPLPERLSSANVRLSTQAPATPFLEPPAHLRGGPDEIEILATPFSLGERVDWNVQSHGPLFAYHLHQHDFLRLGSFEPTDRARRILDWIERHPQGTGWDPHPISLRLLCWGKLLLTAGALDRESELRERMLASMADQAQTLAAGLETRLQANHLLSNLVGVVFAGVLLDFGAAGGPDSNWRAHAGRLLAELEAQILPDGGHEERSPMYHALLCEGVLDLLNVARAAGDVAPNGLVEALATSAARMLEALEVWTHPDGRIALFADSAFDLCSEPARLRDYADRLGVVPSRPDSRDSILLPDTGYARLASGEVALIASVAGPSPAHQPGHAHCDALSFELSLRGVRLVTDTGVFEYRRGPARNRSRATSSHATLQIDGQEQAEVWSAHRVGGRPQVKVSTWDAAGVLEGSCRGWSPIAALHRRRFEIGGNEVKIIDVVEGACHEVVSRLPLDPAWTLSPGEGDWIARGRDAEGAALTVRFDLPSEYVWTIEEAPSYPSFGCRVDRPVLVGRADRAVRSVIRISIVE